MNKAGVLSSTSSCFIVPNHYIVEYWERIKYSLFYVLASTQVIQPKMFFLVFEHTCAHNSYLRKYGTFASNYKPFTSYTDDGVWHLQVGSHHRQVAFLITGMSSPRVPHDGSWSWRLHACLYILYTSMRPVFHFYSSTFQGLVKKWTYK